MKFLAFASEAARFFASTEVPPPESLLADFKNFAAKAIPLIVTEIKRSLPQLAKRAALTERWMVTHDLLSISGLSYAENPYIELVAWALDPATHPASAQQRQRAWLKAVGLDEDICGDMACVPITQLITDDGIPDLVLQFESTTVVIEAKTGSLEHAAPSGDAQTIAYAKAVPLALNLVSDHKIEIVFLTPDRRQAENESAKETTFVEFALCIAGTLDDVEMPADTRAAFAMLFTHFLTCATATTVSVREIINRISKWSKQSDWTAEEQILQRMNDLLAAVEILIPERTQ